MAEKKVIKKFKKKEEKKVEKVENEVVEEKEEAEEVVKEPKKEKKKEKFDLEKKIETIRNSKMSKKGQDEYIKQLSPTVEPKGKMLFSVYCRLKKITSGMQAGMKAHPKAKGITLATRTEWDEIFDGFFGK